MSDSVPMIETRAGTPALADLVAVEETRDGQVRVTVGAFGDLRELHLDPRVFQTRDAAALAADIVAIARAAADSAAEHGVAALGRRERHEDIDLAFDPVLDDLDRRIAAPPADGLRIDYAGFRRYLVTLRDQTLDLRETAESGDGLITATVGGRGELLDLTLDWRVHRDRTSTDLAEDILATVRLAAEQIGHRVAAISRRIS
jgi:DNA-binding protein YbaB